MNANSIKFWSFFWRYGFIILIPIEMIVILIINNLILITYVKIIIRIREGSQCSHDRTSGSCICSFRTQEEITAYGTVQEILSGRKSRVL